MRYLITGGNRGLGLDLATAFSADSISRSSGADITKDCEAIAQKSLEYDVFINNAFDGPPHEPWACFAQVNVLHSVYFAWKEARKQGLIINIGSIGSKSIVSPEPSFETYRVAKAALEHASKQCTRAFKENLVPFKTTLITVDRLDTPLSRSRPTWTGNGIDSKDIVRYIEFMNGVASNTCIEETVLYVNLEHQIS